MPMWCPRWNSSRPRHRQVNDRKPHPTRCDLASFGSVAAWPDNMLAGMAATNELKGEPPGPVEFLADVYASVILHDRTRACVDGDVGPPTCNRHLGVRLAGGGMTPPTRAAWTLGAWSRPVARTCRDSAGGAMLRILSTSVAVPTMAIAIGCSDGAGSSSFHSLDPVASSDAPLSWSADIALVSEDVACVINSFEVQIHCRDRNNLVVGVFGREGDGPGEFRGLSVVERGPNGTLAAVDSELGRVTLFDPFGKRLSETPIPGGFVPHKLAGNRLFGVDLSATYASRSPGGPIDFALAEVALTSGEVLWTRTGLSEIAETECGNIGMGWPRPDGGYVFWACARELVFLDHEDAVSATVVISPTYFEEMPNDRDARAYLYSVRHLAGGVSLPKSTTDAYLSDFRSKPKPWHLASSTALGFDSQGRLWVGTTRDRDTFSYLDIWAGSVYVETVRIRDRLIGYDLLGTTLAALVERAPGSDGIARRAIDWYSIDGLDVGSQGARGQ